MSEGFDPTRGIMHEPREGSPAFVFDVMEPERSKVDRAVLNYLKTNPLHPADFTIRADGVCRLNPEMARRLVLGCSSSVRYYAGLELPSQRFNS